MLRDPKLQRAFLLEDTSSQSLSFLIWKMGRLGVISKKSLQPFLELIQMSANDGLLAKGGLLPGSEEPSSQEC